MFFLLNSPNAFHELVREVTGKWETISLLVLLLFFLCGAALFYAILQAVFRPNAVIHHMIILIFCILGGWQISSVVVRYGLSQELHKQACLELMERHLNSASSASTYCQKKNPIRLKYGGPAK